MGAKHADRLWMFGGIAGAVLLLVIGWFLAISPMNAEADSLRAEAEDTQTQLITLRRRLSELQEQNAKLDTYRTALKANQQALPTHSGVPDFLRELQASGDTVDVHVPTLSVSQPETSKTTPTIYELPITLGATGRTDDLRRFLDQLQLVQPRALLIESASLTDGEKGEKSLSIKLRAFVTKDNGKTPAAASTASPATSGAAD